MKKRILSFALALILIVSAVTVPVSAASGKDVFNYLKSIAMAGSYDSDRNWYYDGFQISNDFFYGIYYLVDENYMEASIFCDEYEVTWRISSNPTPSYNAYMMVYDDQNTKGTVSIAANYNGGAYSSFKKFTGNTALKSAMLEVISDLLPAVVEFTRAVINENDYSLRDLGLTAYNKCDYIHAYDHGQITQPPTCVAPGTMTYTCRVCGEIYTEEIDPTGEHSWDQGTVAVPPTCTEPGVRRFTCAFCYGTFDQEIPALGHAWNEGETAQEPGCVTEGVLRYTCANCGSYYDEAIPAAGHAWSFVEVLTAAEEPHACTGLYECTRCGETREGRLCASEVFEDMPAEGNWAHNPIDWAYFNHITSGKTATTFAPNDTVTRAEAMTFLWLTLGSPEPETAESPFEDVKEGRYYTKPVLWAVENGITSGTSETTFSPKDPCTRAQILTFIWIAAGRPEPETAENPFEDVKEGRYYYKAVLWGVENHITSGIDTNLFGTNNTCTRAQIVAFLYKGKDLMK